MYLGRDERCPHPTGTSPAPGEDNHPEPHQTLWTLPPCSPSLADLGVNMYYSPGVLLVNDSSITAVFDGAISVSISAVSGMLNTVCSLPDRYRNSTKGLLGEDFWHGCRARVQSPLPTSKQAGKHWV